MTNAQAKTVVGFDIDMLETAIEQAVHKVTFQQDEEGNATSGLIIVGKNSPEYQEISRKIRIANIQRSNKRNSKLDLTTESGATIIADSVDKNEREYALGVVKGWFGFTSNGKQVAFEAARLPALFDRFPQLQTKVLNELDADANFMKA